MLWDLAKRRASFRSHLITYLLINAFFWALWLITGERDSRNGFPWPLWPALGWGIGLAFHYLGAYGTGGQNAVEKEYEKLQNKKNQAV